MRYRRPDIRVGERPAPDAGDGMLIIRDEQLDAFRDAAWTAFVQGIEAEIRTELVARSDPSANQPLGLAVAEAIELAQRHGFRTRPHLARFARFVMLAGPGWENAGRAALDDDMVDDDTRLARLVANAKD